MQENIVTATTARIQQGSPSLRMRILLLGLLGICLLGLLLPASSAAQTPDSPVRIIDVAHDPGGPMTVTFEVATSSLGSLEVVIDGAPVDFELSSTATTPKIVLAVENSASLSSGHLAQLQTSILSLFDATNGNVELSIVAYGGGTEVALPFTSDRDTISSTIAGLSTVGGSALFSGVTTAAELATEADGDAIIVLVTYGWDWGTLSTDSREASLTAIEVSGAPVYVQSMVLFGEDTAYLSALSTDGVIHNIAQLASLPNAESLLGSDTSTTQHTIQIESSALLLGKHQLTLTTNGATDSLTVQDEGLITVTPPQSSTDGSPIPVGISVNDELAAATLTASLNGETLAFAADGSLQLDPWQFAPGDMPLEVSALLGELTLATASTSLTIPSLTPVITTETASEGVIVATVLSQPGTVSALVAIVDGEVVTTSSTGTIRVELPSAGVVSIEAMATDGVALSSVALTSDSTPTASSTGGSSTNLLPVMLAGGLVALAMLGLLAVIWRRRQSTPTAPISEVVPDETTKPVVQTPPTTHMPVELHPVGNWELVWKRHGHDEQRLAVGPGAISVGASPLCDITLSDGDVRFVHAVIGPDGPQLRIHRFGPVAMDGYPLREEDSVLALGTTLAIGNVLVTIGSLGTQSYNGSAAA